ncbi:hypothetical protein Tel_07155 [Candidatus Tenderia electrophaga]|uniref:histidine kinase n=1 Tax=Candidatus Tenderia electrophaga TaxID=1748243 RepID=A0A0S2TCU9_9GAMM|nr:hypothetical protein Tel_07155 [Candidatus Tenderia electrophaga]
MEQLRTEILVVEDDSDIANHLCINLEALGYGVAGKTGNGEEAVALALKLKPHLVIMDIVLDGELDGIDAAETILSNHEVPVLYLTSYDETRLLDRAKITEPYAYLLKPYRERELHIAIEIALHKYTKDSEIKEVKEQLLQAEKLATIGQLAAGVAHEINNPIGYINSNLGALKKYLADILKLVNAYRNAEAHLVDEHVIAHLREIKSNIDLDYLLEDMGDLVSESQEGINRVTKIVQDLKDFSRAHKDEWMYSDIHQGIDSTLNIVHNELKYKAEIVKNYGDLPHVECIPSQLNQVFTNLLVNAAHAIEDHGTITITTSVADGEYIQVKIADDGSGIEPEIAEKIFNPFFSTKPVGKGTGLGLSLSESIIDKHNGRISVDSTPGLGTVFTVTIPLNHEIDGGADGDVEIL